MALNKCMGYSFEEIDKLHNGRINRENYEIGAEGLKAIYEEMLEHSYREQERQKSARCEAEKKLRLILERKEKERQLEEARQESARRQAEKRTLIRSLREYFEQNFLNAYDFYQAKCSKIYRLRNTILKSRIMCSLG